MTQSRSGRRRHRRAGDQYVAWYHVREPRPLVDVDRPRLGILRGCPVVAVSQYRIKVLVGLGLEEFSKSSGWQAGSRGGVGGKHRVIRRTLRAALELFDVDSEDAVPVSSLSGPEPPRVLFDPRYGWEIVVYRQTLRVRAPAFGRDLEVLVQAPTALVSAMFLAEILDTVAGRAFAHGMAMGLQGHLPATPAPGTLATEGGA